MDMDTVQGQGDRHGRRDEAFPWATGSNKVHPPSIIAESRARIELACLTRETPAPSAPPAAPSAPPAARLYTQSARPPSARPPVLHIFSGPPRHNDLAAHLCLHGLRCVTLDKVHGDGGDLLNDAVYVPLLAAIRGGQYHAVVITLPSSVYSISRHINDSGTAPPAAGPLYHSAPRQYPDYRRTGCSSARARHLPGSPAASHWPPPRMRVDCHPLHPRKPITAACRIREIYKSLRYNLKLYTWG